MKKRSYYSIILSMLFILFVCGCDNQEFGMGKIMADPTEGAEPMTLMIYMVGSDLEAAMAAATNDMKEMKESGVDLSKVNLLVYTGGSEMWHDESLSIPVESHSVFLLTENGFSKVNDFEIASMGEAGTLSRFLQYGYDNYKSDSYGLILWDHGNGPVMGYGNDIQFEKDSLTLPELENALAASPFGAEQKLDIIGFDACLMSSVELACIVDDYADYLVASQEVEPAFGWNYSFLSKCGEYNACALAQEIVNEYMSYSENYFAEHELLDSEVTLSVMDLSFAKEAEASLDFLFGKAAEDVDESYSKLVVDRVETRSFGRATTGTEYDLIDVNALMDSMNDLYKEETRKVQDILKKMVVYNESNTAESCGMSMYYPYYNKKYYENSWEEKYSQLGVLPNYLKYLDRYSDIWLSSDMNEFFDGELIVEPDRRKNTYNIQLNEAQAEHFADVGFVILRRLGEEIYSIVYSSKDVTMKDGLLTAKFDGKVIYYSNDLGEKCMPIAKLLDDVEGETKYLIQPNLKGKDYNPEQIFDEKSMMCEAILSVDDKKNTVKVLDFYEESSEELQTGKRPQINWDEWRNIEFFDFSGRYLSRDEKGRILDFWEWPVSSLITWNEFSVADGMNFLYEPIYDDGYEYYIMFNISDVQGNTYSSELCQIELDKKPKEEKTEAEILYMEDDNPLLVMEQDGVSIYMEFVTYPSAGENSDCLFTIKNSNDYRVDVYIEDLIINEEDSLSGKYIYAPVEAYETYYNKLENLPLVCSFGNVRVPESVQLNITVRRNYDNKTFLLEKPFMVNVDKSINPKEKYLPFRGICAGKQVLMEETDSVKVTLLGAGYYVDNMITTEKESWELSGVLCIENISSEAQSVKIKGITANDILVLEEDAYVLGGEKVLEPGQVCYVDWKIDDYIFADGGIDEINDISVDISVTSTAGEKIKSLDIQLDNYNEGGEDAE